MPGGDYKTAPDQGVELCQVKGPNCQEIPSNRIYCKTEGRSVLVCNADLKAWRDRVASTTAERHRLELKCPLCADWSPDQRKQLPPQVTITLQGSAAEAIDKAMHAEGLLVDIRQKVLTRLAQEAPWLAFPREATEAVAAIEADLADMKRP